MGTWEHDELLRDAVRVDQGEDPLDSHPVRHSTHTVKKIVEVPYEETVRVPVKKKVATPGVEKKVVRGVELVPVRRYKEVKETVIEVQEEEVKGYREVWVKKKVPYTEIVKKPVRVTKVRQIPYTDYEEKEVQVTVDVPCDKVQTRTGYRDDRILKTKLVEVEQDVTIEHRPAIRSEGARRVRELGDEKDFGIVERGHSMVGGRRRPASARPSASRHHSGGASATTGPEEWIVRVSRSGTQLLGLHTDTTEGFSVLVRRIGGGLLSAWNAAHPDREVRAGDRVIAVNGQRGDAQRLIQLMSMSGGMELTVRGERPLVLDRTYRQSSARGRSGAHCYR